MKLLNLIVVFLFVGMVCHAQSQSVKLRTNMGDITLLLYDDTPLHREAFLKSIREGIYKDAAFNRVIKDFVSQGGELDETILDREKGIPEMPLKRIDAEILAKHFHKKGALGAGRNDNPEKKSYLSQIYLVAGKKITVQQLDALEKKKGLSYSTEQRAAYLSVGGTPHLDGDYTVFGEIVEGMDVADAINTVATNSTDLPIKPVVFHAEILSHARGQK